MRRRDNGETVAYCATCGMDTLHCRAEVDNPDLYSCFACECSAVAGHIPMHKIDAGMHFKINAGNGAGVLFVHYSADPAKNPETPDGALWYKNERRQFHDRPQEWNRRYEIDFMGRSGPRIFPEFDDSVSFRPDLEFDPSLPLLAGFDFGTRHPACHFGQWDNDGRYRILVEMLGDDPHAEFWYGWVNRILKLEFFPKWGMEFAAPDKANIQKLHNEGKLFAYGDANGGNQRDRFKVTDIGFARQYGWRIRYEYGQSPISKISKVRALTIPQERGLPRLLLKGRGFWIRGADPLPVPMDPRANGAMLAALMGGYHWQMNAKGVLVEPPRPMKDGKEGLPSHLIDTLLDVVSNTFDIDRGVEIEIPVNPETLRNDYLAIPKQTPESIGHDYDDQVDGFYFDGYKAFELEMGVHHV